MEAAVEKPVVSPQGQEAVVSTREKETPKSPFEGFNPMEKLGVKDPGELENLVKSGRLRSTEIAAYNRKQQLLNQEMERLQTERKTFDAERGEFEKTQKAQAHQTLAARFLREGVDISDTSAADPVAKALFTVMEELWNRDGGVDLSGLQKTIAELKEEQEKIGAFTGIEKEHNFFMSEEQAFYKKNPALAKYAENPEVAEGLRQVVSTKLGRREDISHLTPEQYAEAIQEAFRAHYAALGLWKPEAPPSQIGGGTGGGGSAKELNWEDPKDRKELAKQAWVEAGQRLEDFPG